MAAGAAALAARLYAEGRIDGVLGAGGSGNTAIATAAMRALPVGVPKLMVSTLAAGDTRDYVGGSDVTMMPSVVDVAGLNSISARVLANAAAAMAGMVGAPPVEHDDSQAAGRRDDVRRHDALRRPRARACWRRAATRCSSSTPPAPAGGRWRRWSTTGFLAGVLDMTTTELGDDLVGGVLQRRARPAGGGGPRGHPAGRLARRAGHGQLRRARHGPAAVRGPQPLRAQPDGDADAHDAGGERGAGRRIAAQAVAPRPGRPCCSSRCAACR